ncbi:EpsG family protein [Burkholderia anthina]|uniref:EpsG family protein n=1 Tax=Burkholderia anthina TaxID=179879 RepID=UPI001CF160AC|nr:EpsG family protein [Burkholderia anthina]MCA8093502.1 EpsG family protein [Burkholderia anthina]
MTTTIYFIGYLGMLASAAIGMRARVAAWRWLAAGIAPAATFAVLRGRTGTDTAIYQDIIAGIWSGNLKVVPRTLEPGFVWLVRALEWLGHDPRIATAILSLLIVIVCVAAFGRSTEDACVFATLIFPLFFYDMAMSGLRYGVAFCAAKLASDAWSRRRRGESIAFAAAAAGMHVSAALLVVLLQIGRLRLLRYAGLAVAIGGVLFAMHHDALLAKVGLYAAFTPPAQMSGSAPLVLALLTLAAGWMLLARMPRTLVFLFVCEIASFALARMSYAGLRFQWLVLFAMGCQFVPLQRMPGVRRGHVIVSLAVIGAIGFAMRLRNMLGEYGLGPSPFLPYRFFWQ